MRLVRHPFLNWAVSFFNFTNQLSANKEDDAEYNNSHIFQSTMLCALALLGLLVDNVHGMQCTTTDGSKKNDGPCQCGSTLPSECKADEICYSTQGTGSCRKNDYGRFGFMLVQSTEDTYETCSQVNGRTSILEKDSCEDAAKSMGLTDQTVDLIDNEKRPPGCFWSNTRLMFNKAIFSNTGGIKTQNEAACSSIDQCLCWIGQECPSPDDSFPVSFPSSIDCICRGKLCRIKSDGGSNGKLYCIAEVEFCGPECPLGKYRSKSTGGVCVGCSAGKWSATIGITSDVQCLSCIPGQYTIQTGQSQCTMCMRGHFLTDDHRNTETQGCDACPKGQAQGKEGKTFCVPCRAGRVAENEGAIECSICPIGRSSVAGSTCQPCKLGETTDGKGGAATCSSCSLGMFGRTPGVCQDCRPGFFASDKGLISCTECPVNTYLFGLGKSSQADCSRCTSEKTTGISTGNTNASACVCKRDNFYADSYNGGGCLSCPIGANCSRRDGVLLHELVAVHGYWRPDGNSTIFSDCRQGYKGTNALEIARQRCCPEGKCNVKGELNAYGNSTFNTTDDQCLEGKLFLILRLRLRLCLFFLNLVCANNMYFLLFFALATQTFQTLLMISCNTNTTVSLIRLSWSTLFGMLSRLCISK